MGRKRLALSESNGLTPNIVSDRKKESELKLINFFHYHTQFISSKLLGGLSSRTLKDHEIHMGYFKKYLVEDQRINLDKTPEDTIKPLSDSDVKKMLKAPDKSTYSGYRDFTLMVLMLDCGIRVGEAVNLKVSDVDLKMGLINVRAESAKTRIFRQLPISPKTCKLMKELVKIAQDNQCDYIFQSTYGGHLDKNVVIQNFEKYGKKAGVKVGSGFGWEVSLACDGCGRLFIFNVRKRTYL